ncbi:MAG: GGDEF domain-containing protein, partial [Oscillospiraceae bacterium]
RLINLDLESNKIEHYLLLLDLDEFKTINDTYGHLVGDKAIIFAAKTFTSLCNNKCYIGRFGGDEFIIYTKERYDKHEIVSLVNEIIKTFNNGFEHNNITIKLSCSIGISVSPYNGTDYKELLKKSDLTIYEVKNSGKNSYKFY